MGHNLAYQRYAWFHREIQAKRYPNATTLAAQFEIATKTAQRSIEEMRDFFGAPFVYHPVRRGYYYEDSTFELPTVQVTQEELLSILVARNMLANSAGGVISGLINRFGQRLYDRMGDLGLDEARMKDAFSATWNEYAPAQGGVFQTVTKALLNNRNLRFDYLSPKDQQKKSRIVEPHHLQHYMGNWTLIAFCRLKNDWRKFMLSRMSGLKMTEDQFAPRPRAQWQGQLEGGFGIFQGGELTLVRLRFNAFRAAWIREQLWHPEQKVVELPDGGLEIAFPVCQFHEIKMKVLQFGGDVEVFEPAELRKLVREEIVMMAERYR